MSLVMFCFPCCIEEPAPRRRRPKIDRSMIGTPMDFKHTGHLGSGDVAQSFDIQSIQTQMQSKGGYENNCVASNAQDGVDANTQNNTENQDSKISDHNISAEEKPQHENEPLMTSKEPNRTMEPNQL